MCLEHSTALSEARREFSAVQMGEDTARGGLDQRVTGKQYCGGHCRLGMAGPAKARWGQRVAAGRRLQLHGAPGQRGWESGPRRGQIPGGWRSGQRGAQRPQEAGGTPGGPARPTRGPLRKASTLVLSLRTAPSENSTRPQSSWKPGPVCLPDPWEGPSSHGAGSVARS